MDKITYLVKATNKYLLEIPEPTNNTGILFAFTSSSNIELFIIIFDAPSQSIVQQVNKLFK